MNRLFDIRRKFEFEERNQFKMGGDSLLKKSVTRFAVPAEARRISSLKKMRGRVMSPPPSMNSCNLVGLCRLTILNRSLALVLLVDYLAETLGHVSARLHSIPYAIPTNGLVSSKDLEASGSGWECLFD